MSPTQPRSTNDGAVGDFKLIHPPQPQGIHASVSCAAAGPRPSTTISGLPSRFRAPLFAVLSMMLRTAKHCSAAAWLMPDAKKHMEPAESQSTTNPPLFKPEEDQSMCMNFMMALTMPDSLPSAFI